MKHRNPITQLQRIEEHVSVSALDATSLSKTGDLALNPQSTSRSEGPRRASSITLVVLAIVIPAMLVVSSSGGFKDMTGATARVSRAITQGFGSKPAPASPGTALLLENRPTARTVTQIALEQQGYKVLVAHSKKQALELVDRNSDSIMLIVVPRRMFDNALMVPGAQVLITN
jgi:hypothetical protein